MDSTREIYRGTETLDVWRVVLRVRVKSRKTIRSMNFWQLSKNRIIHQQLNLKTMRYVQHVYAVLPAIT